MARCSQERYWNWADFSYREIVEGRARGNRRSLWLRAKAQTFLFRLGNFAQLHSGPVFMLGFVVLILCALGLYKAKVETNTETLWIEVGGRLEKELIAYSKTYGSDSVSYELIIQTPHVEGTNILTAPALLKHLQFVEEAMKIDVNVFDATWTISDLCVKPSVQKINSQMSFINKALEQLIPCIVITPLDCFWDGAKIHKQTLPVTSESKPIQWKNFNPKNFTNVLKKMIGENTKVQLDQIESMLNEAGISDGYMKKPCLDPKEPECPESAPNKDANMTLNVGKELTGGCKGFAEKFMEWPENLIVGGVHKSKSGVITRAEALQTVINLMTDKNLHEWWLEGNGFIKAKIQHIDEWSVEKARIVREAWQRKFTDVLNDLSRKEREQNILAFSNTYLNDLIKAISAPNKGLIAGGYVLMLVYSCFTMIHLNSMVQSQGFMGVLGVLLVSLSVAAGLGVCSIIGISFNAVSTQVLPFLVLGLGVDDMFLLSHAFRDLNGKNLQSKEQAGYCLSTTGVSIMLTSCTNAVAFFMAAIIPVPALRAFCIKAGVVIIFNFFAVVIIYPSMIAMDIRRRENQRYDIFCCVQRDSHTRVTPFRVETTSSDHSMVTMNQTTGDDASCHQISTVSANVSVGQLSGQAFILPGVELKASANCNFSESICNGLFGGNIMALPGMANTVVTVSSEHLSQDDTSSQNANANVNANISNSSKGSSLNINASSSACCAGPTARAGTSFGNRRPHSRVNDSCCQSSMRDTDSTKRRSRHTLCRNEDQKNGKTKNHSCGCKRKCAQSSVNVSQNIGASDTPIASRNTGPHFGNFQITSNAVACSNKGDPCCSSNTEVILRPEGASAPEGPSSSSWQINPNNTVLEKLAKFSLTQLTKKHYAPLLQKTPVKVLVLVVSAVMFSVTVFGCFQVKDGMDAADVIPTGTKVAEALKTRTKYFSFYDVVIVTKGGFNYVNGQEKLYQFHEAFAKVDNIIKSREGKLPKFWLMYFREWLEGLQRTFDAEWDNGAITVDGALSNASSDGKLAYRLLLHTGDLNYKEQVKNERLVDNHGIINRRGFYSFLRAWYHLDRMSYTMSQAKIRPAPESWRDEHDRRDILPAEPIKSARIPFYLSDLKDTADYVKAIKHVRAICDKFNDNGLPNYPRGVPFTFWEQYIWLRRQLLITVIVVLAASFVVISAVLVNVWTGSIVVVVLAMITVELFGFLGLAGIKLSAIPAVTLVFSIGVSVEFTVHLCMVFVASVGDRNQRLQQSLETVLSPVVHGAISTMLGIIMLAGSEFDFVVKYFFHVLAALILVGCLNGIVFLPVVLSLIGPNPEVVPLREFSTPESSTRSWLRLVPFDRNTRNSAPTVTRDTPQLGPWKRSIETDDMHLRIASSTENPGCNTKMETWRNVTPKHHYGKNVASTTENPRRMFTNYAERTKPEGAVRTTASVTKVTANATVTVELQQQDPQCSQPSTSLAPIPLYPASDLEIVDLEEFV